MNPNILAAVILFICVLALVFVRCGIRGSGGMDGGGDDLGGGDGGGGDGGGE